MVAPLFSTLFPNLISGAINKFLQLDPQAKSRLRPLTGRIMRLDITIIDLRLYFKIDGDEIHVLDYYNGPIDASITGTPFSLIQTWMQSYRGKKEPITKLTDEIVITGDPHLVQTVNDILQQVNIDWEAQIAVFTGNTVANQVSEICSGLKACFQQTQQTVDECLTECLQEKSELLPLRVAIDEFCTDVDVLRDDAERLEAKFESMFASL